ncbi:hypothetical protein ACVIJ6_005164 [Bradyrhizobium sp. USDA 4369]
MSTSRSSPCASSDDGGATAGSPDERSDIRDHRDGPWDPGCRFAHPGYASFYPRANTSTPFAGIVTIAELGWPCSAGPFAVTEPLLPTTPGLTQLS